jgi:type I restriction enzyme R subunit
VKTLLAEKGPGLVFAMIQKYQERDLEGGDVAAHEDDAEDGTDTQASTAEFPLLNEDESIVLLIDEAHRSHTNTSHANMMKALPNAAKIGFTGTPIIMGDKKRTHDIFGAFLDQYRLRSPRRTGPRSRSSTRGAPPRGRSSDGRDLDELFEDMLHGWTPEEMERIKAKYATKGHVTRGAEAHRGQGPRHAPALRPERPAQRLQGPGGGGQPTGGHPVLRRLQEGAGRAGEAG